MVIRALATINTLAVEAAGKYGALSSSIVRNQQEQRRWSHLGTQDEQWSYRQMLQLLFSTSENSSVITHSQEQLTTISLTKKILGQSHQLCVAFETGASLNFTRKHLASFPDNHYSAFLAYFSPK